MTDKLNPEVEQPLQNPEKGPEKGPDLAELQEKAKKCEAKLNQDQAELCQLLNPELPLERQRDRMARLEGLIVEMLAKLGNRGVPLEVLKNEPQMLSKLVMAQGLKVGQEMTEEEQTALTTLEALLEQPGSVGGYFRDKKLWEGMIDRSDDLLRRPMEALKKCYEDYPGITTAVSASVLAGLGMLAYNLFMSKDEKKGLTGKQWMFGLAAACAAVGYVKSPDMVEWAKQQVADQPIKSFGEGEVRGDHFTPPEANDRQKPSNTIFIGDSIARGLAINLGINQSTDFIGGDGRRSSKVLNDVKENKDKFKHKEIAVINVGGNDIAADLKPEDIVKNIKEIVDECHKAGIEKVILLTRFPYDSRMRLIWKDEFEPRKRNSKVLRDLLIEMSKDGRLEKVEIADLYEPFADAEGYLKGQYIKEEDEDFRHPKRAYGEASGILQAKVGKDKFVRRLAPEEVKVS